MSRYRVVIWSLIVASTLLSAVYYPIHWDEGWTFCSARNLAEVGHYGCSYNGNLTATRLTTSWVTVVMAATGFKLFGVNYIAGRALFVVATLLLVFVYSRLVRRLFDEASEVICLGLILSLSPSIEGSPVLMGATAWGEVSSLLAMSIGFLLLLTDSKGNIGTTLIRSLTALPFFIFAACIKIQSLPFLATALSLAGLLALLNRSSRRAGFLMVYVGICTWFGYKALPSAPLHVHSDLDMTGFWSYKIDMTTIVAKVTHPTARWEALCLLVPSRTLILLPFAIFVWRALTTTITRRNSHYVAALPMVLFSLIYLLWFLILAASWERYSVLGLLIATGPAAFILANILGRSARLSSAEISSASFGEIPNNNGRYNHKFASAVVITLGVANLTYSVFELVRVSGANKTILDTVEYINTHIPETSAIETYDTSLFAFIKRPFIYPPDDYHALFVRDQTPVPSELQYPRPDYFVVGHSTRWFQLDTNRLGGYEEIMRNPLFVIFRREQKAFGTTK